MSKKWIIGGSGFIGSEVLNNLHSKNYFNLDINAPQNPDHITNWIMCDINKNLEETFIPKKNDEVWIFAAEHRDDVRPISKYYQTNVEALKNILKVIKKVGIKKILFLSSVAVYGRCKFSIDEETPKTPVNHYGRSKLMAEELLLEWAISNKNSKLIIIRPTAVFGNKNRGNIFRLFKASTSKKFVLPGEGDAIKSIAYVKNLSNFISFVSSQKLQGINIYNYADKPNYSVREIIEICREIKCINKSFYKIPQIFINKLIFFSSLLNLKKLPIVGVYLERVEKINTFSEIDSSKAFKSGFIPKFSLRKGIKDTLKSI